MKASSTLLFLFVFFSVSSASAGWFGSLWRYKETNDVTYCRAQGLNLQLDLYQPRGAEGARPGVILIHGGGWVTGSRKWLKDYAIDLARRGFVVANIDYRLAITPKVPDPLVRRNQVAASFPAAVQDAKCAVRWLRANAARYAVDGNRIAAVGDSAGGNLALMLGFAPHEKMFLGGDLNDVNRVASSAVQAVVNLYGVPDMKEGASTGPQAALASIGSGVNCYHRYLGCEPEACPDRWAQASPLTYLRNGEAGVPVLTLHGTNDSLVPYKLAQQFDDEMNRRGRSHRLVPLARAEHGLEVPGDKALTKRYLQQARNEIASFLDSMK